MSDNRYYPEGYFGPVCDPIRQPQEVVVVTVAEEPDQNVRIIDGPREPNDYVRWPFKTECKERILEDGTVELYDCETFFHDDLGGDYNGTTCLFNRGSCFNWESESTRRFGLDDNFFVPDLSPESCSPFLPDINIRPTRFTNADGSTTIKYPVAKSNPVTYPVNAGITSVDILSLQAKFDSTGNNLVITGDYSGEVELTLEWDDNPNTAGTALGSITIQGQTWTQSGNDGSESRTISVSANTTYPITYSNLNSSNNPIQVKDGGNRLCLKDGDGDDCNANFRISATRSGNLIGRSLWTTNGDTYGVWTNPMVCTLPCIQQEVTYIINFPASDNYYFEFGADDSGKLFLDNDELPLLDITDGIILAGRSDPHVASRYMTAGNHKMVVQCTNSTLSTQTPEDLYIDTSVSWGSITPGPGTAIYTENSGFTPQTGSGSNDEVSGFDVPSDSPTGKYLSFGTYEATATTVTTRTASITLDLTGIRQVQFGIIAGSDTNGGERPNDAGENLEVNVNGGGWTSIALSRRDTGLGFSDYDASYGDWFNANFTILPVHRVSNATIQFRSTGGAPEIAGYYNNLTPSQFAAAHANSGDVYGLYKITRITEQAGSCSAPTSSSYDWQSNPGGWFVKICQGGPCGIAETLDWVRVSLPNWSNFMNSYAVWPNNAYNYQGSPKTLVYTIVVSETDTYTLEYAGDNEITILWDGTQVAQLTGDAASHYQSDHSTTFSVTPGVYQLSMTVNNVANNSTSGNWSDNPAGGAWLLKNSSNDIIRTSADLSTTGSGNLIWHTRLDTLYEYVEQQT